MGVRLAILLVSVWAATAHADAKVDWAAGLVTAEGVGIADRHAPSPAVARGTSRRSAEEAAKQAIAAALPALPLAAGGTVGDRAKRVVDQAFAIAADPDTDGSWRVTMAVPIEAVRLALGKPRAVPAGGDTGPAMLVVDGTKAPPAIGYLDGATIFVDKLPAWAKDAPHATGALSGGAISVAGGSPSTLYIVVR